MSRYYVYRYENEGEIVYVGITSDMKRRVEQHKYDKLGELNNPIIRYFRVPSKTDAEILETALIGYYKTGEKFNVAKSKKGPTVVVNEYISRITWTKWPCRITSRNDFSAEDRKKTVNWLRTVTDLREGRFSRFMSALDTRLYELDTSIRRFRELLYLDFKDRSVVNDIKDLIEIQVKEKSIIHSTIVFYKLLSKKQDYDITSIEECSAYLLKMQKDAALTKRKIIADRIIGKVPDSWQAVLGQEMSLTIPLLCNDITS